MKQSANSHVNNNKNSAPLSSVVIGIDHCKLVANVELVSINEVPAHHLKSK